MATTQFYVDDEHIEVKGGDAKSKIDPALEHHVAYTTIDFKKEAPSQKHPSK